MKSEDRSYIEYLEDIVSSIDKILKYLDTVTDLESFLSNEML